MDDRMKGL